MAPDDVDAGRREDLTGAERAELVALRRRTRVLEIKNEILKTGQRLLRENVLPRTRLQLTSSPQNRCPD